MQTVPKSVRPSDLAGNDATTACTLPSSPQQSTSLHLCILSPSTRYSMTSSRNVAVLDDYHSLSTEYLQDSHGLAITTYKDTIPFSSELVERLKPFDTLVTMRERTAISRELIDALPNLRVILTTGMRNRGIDVEYAKERGIVVAGTPYAAQP